MENKARVRKYTNEYHNCYIMWGVDEISGMEFFGDVAIFDKQTGRMINNGISEYTIDRSIDIDSIVRRICSVTESV